MGKITKLRESIKSLIAAIDADSNKYELNLNEKEGFQNVMQDLMPPTQIELIWKCEVDQGNFYTNIQFNYSKEINQHLVDLQRELNSSIANKIDANYYELRTCSHCHEQTLLKIPPHVTEAEKDQTHYCLDCGYPRGIFSYQIIAELNDSIENLINPQDLPDAIKEGEIWEQLKIMYNLE